MICYMYEWVVAAFILSLVKQLLHNKGMVFKIEFYTILNSKQEKLSHWTETLDNRD